MEFGKQLAKYRKEHKIDQKDIADLLNVTTQTISTYETGKNKIPYEKLIILCNYYKINPLDLICADLKFNPEEKSQEYKHLIEAYRGLSYESDKKQIVDFILGIGEYDIRLNPIETESKIIYRFPVFKQEAAAGIGILNNSDNYDMEEFRIDAIPDNAVFAMSIKGDSMYDEETGHIKDKAIVLVNPKDTDHEGKIVIANLDGECVCKRYTTVEDHVEFKSDNHLYQDENKDSRKYREPKVIGVVLGVIEDEKFIPVK